jgi:hypothetical protein
VSGGDASQNGAPPPPPPPTGSPFGRFLTQPVFLVALVALMISLPLVALSLEGGSNNSGPQSVDEPLDLVQGRWSAIPSDAHGGVDLVIRSGPGADDGRLTRFGGPLCSGTLTYVTTSGDTVVFDYAERRNRDVCPARSTVELTPLGGDRLRFVEKRNGSVVAEDVLTAP